jgi:serine O-acetyltransferase
VTIGANAKTAYYPTSSDDVIIYPGAKLIGGILVGKGSIVGANGVVIKDVPTDTTAGGASARVISGRKHNEIL